MIITSSRIKTSSGHKAVANHVLRGRDNERIITLSGGEYRLENAIEDAKRWGRAYGIRHFTINPAESISREQAAEVLKNLADEFQFDPSAATVIEHQKPRADGQAHDRHWHVLLPEVDPLTGRCMSSSHTYARQEKVARIAEIQFGHTVTPGRHNRAVVQALRQEGRLEIAEKLEQAGITKSDLPNSSFTASQHQTAKRLGDDMPALKQAVSAAWERSDGRKALEAALQEQGLKIDRGDKRDTWILTDEEGRFLGALHRLAGVRKGQVSQRMQEVPVHENQHKQAPERPARPARPIAPDVQRSQVREPRNESNPRLAGGSSRERRARPDPRAHGPTNEDRAAGDSDREADRPDRKEARDRQQRIIAAAKLRSRIRQYPERLKPPPPPKKRTIRAEGAFYHPLAGQQIRSDRQAHGLAWRWQQLGFQTAFDAQSPRSVVIQGDGWAIRDFGNLVTLSTVDDRAIAVMVDKAKREWGGTIECSGSPQFLEASWLECQRQGVAFSVKGDPNWQPPEHIRMAWELEQQEMQYAGQEPELSELDSSDYTNKSAPEPIRFGL